MIRTGKEYIESLRDGRELYLGDEEVKDITTCLKLRPPIESIARCYDLTWNRRGEFTSRRTVSFLNPLVDTQEQTRLHQNQETHNGVA